jgi:ArsR family transcriptional regulator
MKMRARAAQVVEFERIAEGFQTLGEPARLRILQALTADCRSVSDIVVQVGLPQPLVSHHLRILRDRGFARAERRGAFTFY